MPDAPRLDSHRCERRCSSKNHAGCKKDPLMSFYHIIKRILSLRRFDNERVVPLQSPRGKCESLPVLPKSFENKFAVATEPQRGELKCSPALGDCFVDKISVVPKML